MGRYDGIKMDKYPKLFETVRKLHQNVSLIDMSYKSIDISAMLLAVLLSRVRVCTVSIINDIWDSHELSNQFRMNIYFILIREQIYSLEFF